MLKHVLLYVIAVYVTITLALVTFDLIVEGHGSIRHPLPFNTVENSAQHRESHHTEDGLQKKHHITLHVNQRCLVQNVYIIE